MQQNALGGGSAAADECSGKLFFIYIDIFGKKSRREGTKRFQTQREAVVGCGKKT